MESIVIMAWVTQKWNNPTTRWNPEHYGGVKRVNIRSFRTWTPDIYAYGNVEAQFKYNGLLNNLKTQVRQTFFYNLVNWFMGKEAVKFWVSRSNEIIMIIIKYYYFSTDWILIDQMCNSTHFLLLLKSLQFLPRLKCCLTKDLLQSQNFLTIVLTLSYKKLFKEVRSCYFQSYKCFLLLQQINFSILI